LFSGRPEHFESCEEGLKLLLSLIVAEIAQTKSDRVNFSQVLEQANREFSILESMNDPKHVSYASNLLLDHPDIFLPVGSELEKLSDDERSAVLAKAAPHARLLWHFCVLLCRELFEGEHILRPSDAQLLGLVDEVSGGGPISSRRDFRIALSKPSPGPVTAVTKPDC
jgi:hypothetical protein